MPKIRIETPTAQPGQALNAHGTRIWLDDVEVKDVRDIEMRFPVDGAVECHLELFGTEGLTLETGAEIHYHLHIPQGYVLVQAGSCMVIKREEESSNGSDK